VTIDWGDGQTSPGDVHYAPCRTDPCNLVQIVGGHTYTRPGTFAITGSATDQQTGRHFTATDYAANVHASQAPAPPPARSEKTRFRVSDGPQTIEGRQDFHSRPYGSPVNTSSVRALHVCPGDTLIVHTGHTVRSVSWNLLSAPFTSSGTRKPAVKLNHTATRWRLRLPRGTTPTRGYIAFGLYNYDNSLEPWDIRITRKTRGRCHHR